MKKLLFPVLAILLFASWNNKKTDTAPTPIPSVTKTDTVPTRIPSVTIGTQVWMLKNLDVSTYRNGEPIPKVTNPTAWAALTTGAYCYYKNDSVTYAAIYGKLYNWYAVNDVRGLAPTGWHVPSDGEWNKLVKFIDAAADTTAGFKKQSTTAGDAMKETGTTHWSAPNTGATNSSGFTGLPGGDRTDEGTFSTVTDGGYWWSSTENVTRGAWLRYLLYLGGGVEKSRSNKQCGFSVRCLKD